MEPEVLLAKLQNLSGRTPDLNEYSPSSADHTKWIAMARALITRGSIAEEVKFDMANQHLIHCSCSHPI
jgi:hypothetical protein